MSVKDGSQFVSFYLNNNKWAREVRLGNKILQPWSYVSGDSNIQPYVNAYLWTITTDSQVNSESLRNTGYIKFRVPCTELNLKNIKIVDTIAGSQIARVLIYIKDVNGNEIMHAEMRAERERNSEFYFIVEYYDKNGNQLTGGGYTEDFSSNVIPNWQVFKMDKNSNSITSQVWSSGQEYYQNWTLDEVYNGWHYEIEEVSSEPFIWHFNFGKTIGGMAGSGLYNLVFSRGTASSNTNLPTLATLNRNEDYTLPTNNMIRNPTVEHNYTITYNYNYIGAPADTTDTCQDIKNWTPDGWTKQGHYYHEFNNGQVVCNLVVNENGTGIGGGLLPSVYLEPFFRSEDIRGSVTLPTPTRSGYRFLYWTPNQSGSVVHLPGGFNYTPTASTTLYAQWEAE